MPHGRLRLGGAGIVQRKGVTTPVVRIGWPDQFIEHATTQDELRKKYGLSVENTVARVKAQFGEAGGLMKVQRPKVQPAFTLIELLVVYRHHWQF
jgi:hypothetical protein